MSNGNVESGYPQVKRTARMCLCRFLQFGLQINGPLLALVRDALFFYTAVCHFNIFCLFFGKFPPCLRLLSDNIIGCDASSSTTSALLEYALNQSPFRSSALSTLPCPLVQIRL